MTSPWWQTAVFYQIYPRSFLDTHGDGIGDLEGVRQRLDYLVWLGVDAIWLSPFFRSPMADFGYDVADYCDVDPIFGTLADFDRLLADAHNRGLRVLIDWVPNHTSDQHPWFRESRSSRDNPKRDWYIWRDRPNNWKAAFGGDAWTYGERTGQWYLHLFLPEQPDLNWRNPAVAEALFETVRFWLDRGVDGFRADAVRRLGKDPDLRDNPPNPAAHAATPEYDIQVHVHDHNHPEVHPLLRRLRALVDTYPGERVLVGEAYLPTIREIAAYYGQGDELHLAFNFPLLEAPWASAAWQRCLEETATECDPISAWPAWALANHDRPRQRTRYESEARARVAALLLLTLRGTAFLYAGEELGLEDAIIPPERVRDPGGRDGCRAPLPWDGSPAHGWPTTDPWLPWPPEAERRNVADLRADPASILHLYRRLLAARRASPALQSGAWRPLPAPDGTLAFERTQGIDRRVILANFTGRPIQAPLEGSHQVIVSSDGRGEGRAFEGRLPGDWGCILSPTV